MKENRYTVDQLQAMALTEVAKILGATLDGFWVVTSPPNPATLVMHYTLLGGFKNSLSIKL